MFIRRALAFVLFMTVGATLIACNRLQPVNEPSFTVAQSNQAKVHEAIRQALLERRWSILGQTSNSFEAEYQRGADTRSRVKVLHENGHVSVKYLGSSNLNYGDVEGSPHIHRRYNAWVANLERDIQVEIGKSL